MSSLISSRILTERTKCSLTQLYLKPNYIYKTSEKLEQKHVNLHSVFSERQYRILRIQTIDL